MNSSDSDTRNMEATAPAEQPEPAEMLESVVSFLRRHLVCDQHQFDVLALWVLHTWCFQKFPTAVYLNVLSPEPQCGKSLCLEVLAALCSESGLATGVRPDVLAKRLLYERVIKDLENGSEDEDFWYSPPHTYFLDDCHHTLTSSERQAVISMLNSGSRERTPYAFGDHVYCLFGPKVFAGNAPLPRSLASRCIPIVLRRKKPSEAVVRFDPLTQAGTIQDLRNFMKAFCDASVETPKSAAGEPATNMPTALTAHQQDCAEPLLHVANAIGGHWPDRARAAIVAAFELVEDSEPVQLLADIRASFLLHGNPVHLTTADLLASLISCDDRPWSSWPANPLKSSRRLGGLLSPFQIGPSNLKIEPGKVLKGYRLKDFQDSWERYLSPLTKVATSGELDPIEDEMVAGSATKSAPATSSATANSTISNELEAR